MMATDTLAELTAGTAPELLARVVDVVAAIWKLTGAPAPLIRAALASYLMGEEQELRAIVEERTVGVGLSQCGPGHPGLTFQSRFRVRLAVLEGWADYLRQKGRL